MGQMVEQRVGCEDSAFISWQDALLMPSEREPRGRQEWAVAIANPGSGVTHTEYGVFNPESVGSKNRGIVLSDGQTIIDFHLSGSEVCIGVRVPAGQNVQKVFMQTDGGGFGVYRETAAGTERKVLSALDDGALKQRGVTAQPGYSYYTWPSASIHPGEKRFFCVEYGPSTPL